MKKLGNFMLSCLVLISAVGNAQTSTVSQGQDFNLQHQKGEFFFFWGYNRESFAKSDIRLIGPDYDFTLYNVPGHDMPSPLSSDYYNPTKLTIPQFNFRLGYFISDKYAIALGWDHMKYQDTEGAGVTMSGQVGPSVSPYYSGDYDNIPVVMNTARLVHMEHSNGFNIVNINLERHDQLLLSNDGRFGLALVSGAGIGLDFPWTNSTVFGLHNDDRPHFSGMGAHLYLAANVQLFRHFFIRYTLKGGFANMWDIATRPKGDHSAYAKQNLKYLERFFCVGYQFKLCGNRNIEKES